MRDKIIINTISKVHFITISAFSFIFLSLLFMFVLLQNGIDIESLSLPNVKIEKLYIKWNEKLSIDIKNIEIKKNTKKKNTKIELKNIKNILKTLTLFDTWFEKISIEHISLNDIDASFKYIENQNGFLKAKTNDLILDASLYFESGFFVAKIDKFVDKKRVINTDGYIIFNAHKKLELITSLNINVNDDVKVKFYTETNTKQLKYKIVANENIRSIDHIMSIIPMPKEVKYWAYEAIKTSEIELKYAYGWIDFDNIKSAIKNVRVLAYAKELQYTYNPKLEPVKTKQTELEFKDGILFIRPQDAYQYGFYLNKSWLKIDFARDEELLSLYLLFKGKVNQDILYLLNTYRIKLPFIQNNGYVDTDLKIEVGLRNIGVDAHGTFYVKKGDFNYLGMDIDISNAKILLDNYNVKVKKMGAKYKDIASADVDFKFNAKENRGIIDFSFKKIDIKDADISLVSKKSPLRVKYIIARQKDKIDIGASKWYFRNKIFKVEKVHIPFDFNTLKATLPPLHISLKDELDAHLQGKLILKPLNFDLSLNISKFNLYDIKLRQNTIFDIKYNKELSIKSRDNIKFNFKNKFLCNIENLSLKTYNSFIDLKNTNFKIDDIMTIKLDAQHNIKTKSGKLNIKNINLKYKEFGGIFYAQNSIPVKYKTDSKGFKLDVNKLNISYTNTKNNWKLKFSSLDKLYKHSKLLRDYNISNGNFSIYKYHPNEHTKFILSTKYPYRFLLSHNKKIENYIVRGMLDTQNKNTIKLNINNKVEIDIDDEIKVDAQDVGFNIKEILKYMDLHKNKKSTFKTKVTLNAKNSYIYISENRKIVSDILSMTYKNKTLNARLKHANGNAYFKLKDKNISLYGDSFNDVFMDNLFALSKFKGGSFAFSISGKTDGYNGLLYIKNTTILDYKILNNILAFVNTVPSLMTFSVPGYSQKGLEVKSAYASFYAKNNLFKIDNISMDSKELDLLGRGVVDFNTNKIDLNLNLKTDIGSSVSKIPLVGYILLGDDTVSTSLKITGELKDPDVKTLIAKDIAVAPLNILKRTLNTPFRIFEKK